MAGCAAAMAHDAVAGVQSGGGARIREILANTCCSGSREKPEAGFSRFPSKQALETIFGQIENNELRNQYSLGYSPVRSDAPAGFRAIHVVTKDRTLIVQSREGYYPDR